MKVYVAGPMTGYPEFNFPAFNEGERLLVQRGWEVVNPAKLDALTNAELAAYIEEHGHDPEGGLGEGSMLPAYLRRDFKELVYCDGLVLLDGYRYSPGANAELTVARFLDLKVWRLSERKDWALTPSKAMPNTGVIIETWHRFGMLTYQEQRRQG